MEQDQGLVCATPVAAIVLQHALPQHSHDFREGLVGECVLSHLLHLLSCRSPVIVVRRLPHLGLHFCVVHHDVRPACIDCRRGSSASDVGSEGKVKQKHRYNVRCAAIQAGACVRSATATTRTLSPLNGHLHLVRDLANLPHDVVWIHGSR